MRPCGEDLRDTGRGHQAAVALGPGSTVAGWQDTVAVGESRVSKMTAWMVSKGHYVAIGLGRSSEKVLMWPLAVDEALQRSLCGRFGRILETLAAGGAAGCEGGRGQRSDTAPFSEVPGVRKRPQNCKYNMFSISNRTERPREVHFWP